MELPKEEDVEELCVEDEDEHRENSCGACGEQYGPDEFWIFCDICERWLHGKCVNITPVRAKHIKIYKCPSCNNKRARPWGHNDQGFDHLVIMLLLYFSFSMCKFLFGIL